MKKKLTPKNVEISRISAKRVKKVILEQRAIPDRRGRKARLGPRDRKAPRVTPTC